MITSLVEMVASKIKGRPFKIDREIGIFPVVEYSFSRFVCAIRGFVKFRRLPSKKMVFCGKNVRLMYRKYIAIGTGVTIGDYVMINGLSKNMVVLGDNVNIGMYSIIESTSVLSKIGEGLKMGENSSIGHYSYIGAAGGVRIGNNVIMGQKVNFHAENHIFTDLTLLIRDQGVTRQGIEVQDNCWVGANTTFLDGAFIGKGCVVAAGSVVRGKFPDYSVIGGVPARVIKSRISNNVELGT